MVFQLFFTLEGGCL